jgi:tetratricopeptide (TPR) repeat protein
MQLVPNHTDCDRPPARTAPAASRGRAPDLPATPIACRFVVRRRRHTPRPRHHQVGRRLVQAVCLGLAVACATAPATFDATSHLRRELAAELPQAAARVTIPFAVTPELGAYLDRRLVPSGTEARRAADIVDFVFADLGLTYSLRPTRDATETYRTRSGNCLSFVNLFVGIARRQRLNAFYVEVTDAQRWNHDRGLVLSQGHIVAGVYVGGALRTFDFLPYRPKSYRELLPIDDRTAIAHFHNNLGAEALLAGDLERAEREIETATLVAPGFVKALNNLGVCRARRGDLAAAVALYERALAIAAEDPAVLSNLLRARQSQGDQAAVTQLLDRLAALRIDNPFFFLYLSENALAADDLDAALRHATEALRREPELPEVHVTLARVFLARADLARARHHQARALALDATHPEALALGRLLAPGREARDLPESAP